MQVEGADVTVYRIKDPVSGDIPEQVRHHPKTNQHRNVVCLHHGWKRFFAILVIARVF